MVAPRIALGSLWSMVVGLSSAWGQTAPPTTSYPAPYSPGTGLAPTPALTAPGTGQAPLPNVEGPATSVLTASPLRAGPGTGLPPGTVESPWVGGCRAGGCSGPVGANGPVTYELYFRTGPNFVIGGGESLSAALGTGWIVSGGGRSLFLNPAGDAAWVIDLGLSYTYTNGSQDRTLFVATPQATNAQTGALNGPDQINAFRLESMTRTSFNYAVGRDWFLNGPGYLPIESSWNNRVGLDVGGRWGTARANLIPAQNPDQYLRKSGVTQSFVLGAHWNCEVPVGAWILFGGTRVEWAYTWTNVIPPEDGNIQDLNLLFTCGFRF